MLTAYLLAHLLREAHLLWESLAVPAGLVIAVAAGLASAKSIPRRKALEPIQAGYGSGLALVRYVQLHRHCSEEGAYERLAAFVKQHGPFDDQGSLEGMLVRERQRLVETAQDLLADDPDAIDTI
jgi:hypothetical protein